MTTDLHWRRVGKGSGPGNVLNDRYEVYRATPAKWRIRDLRTGEDATGPRGHPLTYGNMSGARQRAERILTA